MPRHPLTDEEIRRFRKTIMTAAAGIVGRNGLGQLSMRGLADSLGMTAGALYRYYPSKQDLIIDFCRDAITELRNRFNEIHETVDDPLSAIRSMLKAYSRFGLDDSDRFRLLFLENDHGLTSPLLQDEETMLPYRQLAEQVTKAAASGRIVVAAEAEYLDIRAVAAGAQPFANFKSISIRSLVLLLGKRNARMVDLIITAD